MARRPRRSDAMGSAPPRPTVPPAPGTPTTVGQQLEWGTRVLETVGALEPAREAATLLATAIGSPGEPAEPGPDAPLAASQVDRFLAAIARRTRDEPPRF